MPDPTTAYHATTAAAPEWAAEVAGDARDAEIARLRKENDRLNIVVGDLAQIEREGHAEASRRLHELADVKAECCRLTCRNGDLEAEVAGHNERIARLKRIKGEVSISLRPMAGEHLSVTIDEAVTLANHSQFPVAFTFNDTPCVARRGDTADEVVHRWSARRNEARRSLAEALSATSSPKEAP